MKYFKLYSLILFITVGSLLLVPACTHKSLSPAAYAAWVENADNGLCTEQTAGNFTFSLQYKPLEYVALLNKRSYTIDKATLNNELSEIKDMQYYTLRINSKDGKTEMLRTGLSATDEYYRRIEYFSFHLKNDLYLVDGTDSLPCTLFHFERSYDLSPNNSFVLAFPLSENEIAHQKQGKKYTAEKTLVYNDRLLNTGIVKLAIKKRALEHIPDIKL
jgi:hypothetical protein